MVVSEFSIQDIKIIAEPLQRGIIDKKGVENREINS